MTASAHSILETLVKYLYENRNILGAGALVPHVSHEEEPSHDAPAVPQQLGGGGDKEAAIPTVGQALEACDEVCEFVETIDTSLGMLRLLCLFHCCFRFVVVLTTRFVWMRRLAAFWWHGSFGTFIRD